MSLHNPACEIHYIENRVFQNSSFGDTLFPNGSLVRVASEPNLVSYLDTFESVEYVKIMFMCTTDERTDVKVEIVV